MSARDKLRTLLGLPEGKYLSDVEIQIEYETELAHTDSYRKWLEKTHEEWLREIDGKENEPELAPVVQPGNIMDPKAIDIEFVNLSNKATMNLRRIGITSLYDCINHTEEELNKLIGLKPTKTIEISLERYGLALKAEDSEEEASADTAKNSDVEDVGDEAGVDEDKEGKEEEEEEGKETVDSMETANEDQADEQMPVADVDAPVVEEETQTEETEKSDEKVIEQTETVEAIDIPMAAETAVPPADEGIEIPSGDESDSVPVDNLLDEIPIPAENAGAAVIEESVADTSVHTEAQAEEEAVNQIDILQAPRMYVMANDGLDDDPEEEYGSLDAEGKDSDYDDVEVIDLDDNF